MHVVESFIRQGKYDEALSCLEQLSIEEKTSADGCNLLGLVCYYLGDFENAIISLEKAIHQEPGNTEYLFNMGYVYYAQGEYKKAMIILEKCRQLTNETSMISEINNILKDISINTSVVEKKKVLMIAYYYPPLSGSGVFRSLKFSKYLLQFGWIPTIISSVTPQKGWNFTDKTLLEEIPDSINVLRFEDPFSTGHITISEAEKAFRFWLDLFPAHSEAANLIKQIMNKSDIKANLLTFPCSALIWTMKVIQYIDENLLYTYFPMFYTTSGPYSAHLVGLYFKQKYGTRWVADFRDEWINNPYAVYDLKKEPLHKLLYLLEKEIVITADKVICTSEFICKEYQKTYHIAAEDIISITNGYDEEDHAKLSLRKNVSNKFTIVYSGLLYTDQRDISPILKVINSLIESKKVCKDQITFQIIGTSEVDVKNLAGQYGLSDIVLVTGYTTHHNALKACYNANILLCLVGNAARFKGIYTGKIFDYLRTGKTILALAPHRGVVDILLQKSEHGYVVMSTEVKKITQIILAEYQKWLTGQIEDNINFKVIEIYERKYLTEQLVSVFNTIMEDEPNSIHLGSSKLEKRVDREVSKEIPAAIYDGMYKKGGAGGNYFLHYSRSIYIHVWEKAKDFLAFIDKNSSIIDIGCGPGQFANMLFDTGYNHYRGLDFSNEAIELAIKANPANKECFEVGDAFQTSLFESAYTVAIFFEILEHLQEDLSLLQKVRPGTKMLMSVPNFPDPNHVRFFRDEQEVITRYSPSIDIWRLEKIMLNSINCIYLFAGIKC